MVEITGTLERTKEEEGRIEDRWRLPALTKRQARIQALGNSRLKGRNNSSVTSITRLEEGQIPGQSIYEVTVESRR